MFGTRDINIGPPSSVINAEEEAREAQAKAETRMYNNMEPISPISVQDVMQENEGFLAEQSLQDAVDVLYERGMGQVRADLASRGMADSSMMGQAAAQMSGEALLGGWKLQESRERLRLQQRQQAIQQQQFQQQMGLEQQRVAIQRDQVENQGFGGTSGAAISQQRRQADQQYQLSMAQLESQDAWTAMRAAVRSAPADQNVVDEYTDLANRMQRDVSSPQYDFGSSPSEYAEDYMEQDFMSDYDEAWTD